MNSALVTLAFSLMLTPPGKGPAEEVQLVGFVTEQGQKRCLKGWTDEWLDVHHQVGFTRLTGRVDAKPFVRKPVVVTGLIDSQFKWPKIPPNTGECPMAQMRSDWIEGKNGIRIRRTRLGIGALRHTAIRELKGLVATHTDGQLAIRFTNDLGKALKNVEITVHYEGCFGKPGATSRTDKLGALQPGAAAQVKGPAVKTFSENPRGHHYAASTVHISASGDKVYFDLDVPLHALGASVHCPKRKRP